MNKWWRLVLCIESAALLFIVGVFGFYAIQPMGKVNPTQSELDNVLANDTVHLNRWSAEYNCYNFSLDFQKELGKDGYKADLVYIVFTNGAAHNIVSVKVNSQIEYIEPQLAQVESLKVGQIYSPIGEVVRSVEVLLPWEHTLVFLRRLF